MQNLFFARSLKHVYISQKFVYSYSDIEHQSGLREIIHIRFDTCATAAGLDP